MTREDVWLYCLKHHYSAAYAGYWMDHLMCEACRAEESGPPHHIRTRGAGGDDAPENLLALGLACHRPGIHVMGRQEFVRRYPHLRRKIDAAFDRPRVTGWKGRTDGTFLANLPAVLQQPNSGKGQ